MGRRFGQLAIVAGRRGSPARLVRCSIAGPGRRVQRDVGRGSLESEYPGEVRNFVPLR